MVAGTCNYHSIAYRDIIGFRWRISSCAFYLYFVLIMQRQKSLETILVLVAALLVFYFIFDLPLLLKIALVLAAIGIFIPFVAKKIHWAWMKLAHVLGYIMSRVLLTVIYFIFLVPLAFFSKLAGKNNVQLKAGQKSYFKDRNFRYDKESLENVW